MEIEKSSSNELSAKAKEDLVLIEETKEGNNRAFAAIMNRYRDPIYFMLLKMVNNPVDAEDLTMEAFGKAFKSLSTYTPTYAFSTWLFMIATNNCIDFIRKKQANPSIVNHIEGNTDIIVSNFAAEVPDPEESLIYEQKLTTLRDLVMQLKSPYREIIEYRYYKEYSYEEIAKKLNIPIGTVKTQLHRAKLLLQNTFIKNDRH